MFGSCFRTLAVILFQILIFPLKTSGNVSLQFSGVFPHPTNILFSFFFKNRFTGYTAKAVNKHKYSPSHAAYKLWHTVSIFLQILNICLKCVDVDKSTFSIGLASQFCVGNRQLLIKNKTGQEVYLQGVVCNNKKSST